MTRMPRCVRRVDAAATKSPRSPNSGSTLHVVGDVVAAVAQRRVVERQQPEAVDAEPLQVVELLGQAAQVAGAVAVGVGEAADQHLVEDRPLVPERVRGAVGRRGRVVAGTSADAHVGVLVGWAGWTSTVRTWAGCVNGSSRT